MIQSPKVHIAPFPTNASGNNSKKEITQRMALL